MKDHSATYHELNDLLKAVQELPEFEYLDVPNDVGISSFTRILESKDLAGTVEEIVIKAMNKQRPEDQYQITDFELHSTMGGIPWDSYYILLKSQASKEFDEAMSMFRYGRLD
jgi:hypothetical protein